jgi:hypothetical protein
VQAARFTARSSVVVRPFSAKIGEEDTKLAEALENFTPATVRIV